jgi:hypothetical protein
MDAQAAQGRESVRRRHSLFRGIVTARRARSERKSISGESEFETEWQFDFARSALEHLVEATQLSPGRTTIEDRA